jgi:hypothetical protein
MFVAITSIQRSTDNPFPQLVGWIALAGNIFAPIFSTIQKYSLGISDKNLIAASCVTSMLLILLITNGAEKFSMDVGDGYALKLRIALVLVASTIVFAVISRTLPELSLLAYFAFALLPLQRLLDLPIKQRS